MQFDRDLRGEYKEVFLHLREILLSFEGMREEKKENITSYFCEGSGICYLRCKEEGLIIAMFKGSSLEDKYQLFHGNGKHIRHMYMKNIGDIKESILREYFQDAIIFNIEKKERDLMKKSLNKSLFQ